ncbi:MAG: hypothetical protein F7B17_02005 [Desulfurococcales archaeon]|nr:hypothetical protein [Desulfurococcales archaeon]
MSQEGRSYRLVLRKTARGPVIQFRVSAPEMRESTLIRMGGKKASEIFDEMVGVLKKHGFITEEATSENYRAYRLKPEIGPVVGGYLVLIRRSRDPSAWIPFFEDMVTEEKFKGAHALLSHALSLSEELSKISPPPERVRMQLSPKVLDSVSAGFKAIVRKLWGIRKK